MKALNAFSKQVFGFNAGPGPQVTRLVQNGSAGKPYLLASHASGAGQNEASALHAAGTADLVVPSNPRARAAASFSKRTGLLR
jgi:hypothetical protein